MSKKSPQLRFEGFTDDWEERKLGEIFNYEQPTKYIVKSTEYDDNFNTPVLTAGKSFLLGYTDEISGIKNATVENPVVIFDDFTTGSHYVDFPFKIKSSAMKLLSLNDNSDNFYFMFNTLKNIKYVPQSHERHWISKFSSFEIYKPSQEEQQKIGAFFKQLDETIALHQRKLDLLKEQKKGYLQKMFPKNGAKVPELRFAGFADDWEQSKLGDTLIELKSGLSRMLSNNDIGLPVVRANNINDGQFNIDSDVKYWYVNDPQGANTVNYLIRKNDILINFINSEAKMGTATIVENTPIRDTIYTTNILRVRLKKEYDSYYWFALTQINQYKINIKIITKPAVNQASFTTVDFKKLNFMFPNLKEQQKIGSFFKQLDDTIALHQRKLDLLKEQKKGFLQKMFV
ncbi:restriction endonuclease subunit S [Enterococcus durans]|uniref:restriction endonuclease subunit S n=1 Tax=Enterococcus durans TaxID=53345 RepID=UPI0039A5CEE2